MVVSGMAITVSAKPFSDVDAKTNADLAYALNVLNDLGIVKGTGVDADGNQVFGGDDFVTRQQFALFTARIVSAIPDAFVADPNTPVTDFTDCTDPTYFTAINYCAQNGIVNGIGGGLFNPTGNITLQEAVKMLVTALGYSGLSYPVGYLSQANNENVALIGPSVEVASFNFKDIPATQTITRNQMAMLLYNFLLSYYNKLQMVQNAVDGRFESQPVYIPVLQSFGIQKVTGYITGIPYYSTQLNIKNYERSTESVTLTGRALQSKEFAPTNTSVTSKVDLEISYAARNVIQQATSLAFGPYTEQAPIFTTAKALGILNADGTELKPNQFDQYLGLKVIVYRDTRTNASINPIAIPASKVVGTKTDVTAVAGQTAVYTTANTATTTTVPSVKVDGLTSLTLGTDNGTALYDQTGIPDLNGFYNLYMFRTDNGQLISENVYSPASTTTKQTLVDGTGVAVYDNATPPNFLYYIPAQYTTTTTTTAAGVGNRDFAASSIKLTENNMEKQLATQVKNGGHYVLQYVNNGTDVNGMTEFFYIYKPMQVGYVSLYSGGNLHMVGVNGDTNDTWNTVITDRSADQNIKFGANNAYLYTYYNNQLDLYAQLAEVSASGGSQALATESLSNAANALFANNLKVTFAYNTTYPQAMGALQGSDVYGAIAVLASYKIFADTATSTPYYIWNSAGAPSTVRPVDYAVVLGPVTGASTGGTPMPYSDGTIGYLWKVFDATKNVTLNSAILLNGLLSVGDYIGISPNSNGSYTVSRLYTEIDQDLSVQAFNMLSNSGTVNYAWGKSDANNYFNLSNGLATLSPATPTNGVGRSYTGVASPVGSAILTSNTAVIAINLFNSTIQNDTTRIMSRALMNTAVSATAQLSSRDALYSSYAGSAIDSAFIASGTGATAGVANALWVTTTNAVVQTTSPDRYGVVLDPTGSSNDTIVPDQYNHNIYYTRQAYVYTTGSTVNVCSMNLNDVLTDNVVTISESSKITLLGTTYYIVGTAESKLAGSDWGSDPATVVTPFLNTYAIPGYSSIVATSTNGINVYAGKVVYYTAGASATIDTGVGGLQTIVLPTNNYKLLGINAATGNGGTNKIGVPIPDVTKVKGLAGIADNTYTANKNGIYALACVDSQTGLTVSVTFIFTTWNNNSDGNAPW
jgi:hypothetical protein